MHGIRSLVSAAVVCCAATLVAACGTTASSGSASDASADGASQQEAGSLPDATLDGEDSASANDDAATDAGDPAACAKLATSPCLSCCQGLYPTGYQSFGGLELTCACTADLCGPLDGGADSGDAGPDGGALDAGALDAGAFDAGPFGSVACGTTCSAHTSPDSTCLTCLRATLGSNAAPGPCGITVVSACIGNADCKSYFTCVEACPN
jgi:hypothetical protein